VEELTAAERADGMLDALALIEAAAAGDGYAAGVLLQANAEDAHALILGLASATVQLLAERGQDVSEWVAERRADLTRA
jgi:hypothetical protein